MKYYEIDFKISAPEQLFQDACDVLSSLAGEAGLETFEETPTGLKGYVQQQLFDRDLLDAMLSSFPFEEAAISYDVSEAEDRDWNEQWEQEGFEPIVIRDAVIIHDGRHLPDASQRTSSPIEIEIDAHLAFGTGTHETTRMMVSSLLDLNLSDKRVLDCGCGTGILGIAALMLGAKQCVGYDIDEWSVDNARHNAVINRVDDRFTSLLGDASVLSDVKGTFDVVMANINRNILLNDMAAFRSKLNKGGHLLLSGFYQEDIVLLEEKARQLGLHLDSQRTDGEWASIAFQMKEPL